MFANVIPQRIEYQISGYLQILTLSQVECKGYLHIYYGWDLAEMIYLHFIKSSKIIKFKSHRKKAKTQFSLLLRYIYRFRKLYQYFQNFYLSYGIRKNNMGK
jgi:hypothetical protein